MNFSIYIFGKSSLRGSCRPQDSAKSNLINNYRLLCWARTQSRNEGSIKRKYLIKQFALSLMFILSTVCSFAQYSFKCLVKDAATHQPLQSADISIVNLKKKIVSDKEGIAEIKNLSAGIISVKISYEGYENKIIEFTIPMPDSIAVIALQPTENKLEEVIVTSSRTNSRIEDLPTKVEVLGSEEVSEENGIKPSNIASLLGDIAGVQIQQTSATSGNSNARIQGLQGKYTQIIRDGMPLYGSFSSSFGILQILPSDLKQIEIIKGSASTLYGGGAIAGIINLVSKTPVLNKPENNITLNQSTLQETNTNIFLSKRDKRFGYTINAGATHQNAMDINNDGFSDIPKTQNIFLHPRFFIYPDASNTIAIGLTSSYEVRKGGDWELLHKNSSSQHSFFIQNKLRRNTADAQWDHQFNAQEKLTVKGMISFFDRRVKTNLYGMGANQKIFYSEVTYNKKMLKHNMVAGFNINGESLSKHQPDSVGFNNYHYHTIGAFIQDDWLLAKKITIQSGLRLDYQNRFGSFLLPRVSILYKFNSHFTSRVGGGLGYKIPSQPSEEIDERDYPFIQPNNYLNAEKSMGINWDINFKQKINGWNITANQMFYMTEIKSPVIGFLNNGFINFVNAGKPLNTKGIETYVQATHDELEIYIGYTYTLAKQLYSTTNPDVSLSARNKFASIIAYEFAKNCRVGIESSYVGMQYLDNGNQTPGYTLFALMARVSGKHATWVLNCENLLDYRQTKVETIVHAPYNNPIFNQIWGPIEGRVINLSLQWKWL